MQYGSGSDPSNRYVMLRENLVIQIPPSRLTWSTSFTWYKARMYQLRKIRWWWWNGNVICLMCGSFGVDPDTDIGALVFTSGEGSKEGRMEGIPFYRLILLQPRPVWGRQTTWTYRLNIIFAVFGRKSVISRRGGVWRAGFHEKIIGIIAW